MTDDILTTMELILNKVDVSLMATSAFCLHIFISFKDLKANSCLKSYMCISIIQKSEYEVNLCHNHLWNLHSSPCFLFS